MKANLSDIKDENHVSLWARKFKQLNVAFWEDCYKNLKVIIRFISIDHKKINNSFWDFVYSCYFKKNLLISFIFQKITLLFKRQLIIWWNINIIDKKNVFFTVNLLIPSKSLKRFKKIRWYRIKRRNNLLKFKINSFWI